MGFFCLSTGMVFTMATRRPIMNPITVPVRAIRSVFPAPERKLIPYSEASLIIQSKSDIYIPLSIILRRADVR